MSDYDVICDDTGCYFVPLIDPPVPIPNEFDLYDFLSDDEVVYGGLNNSLEITGPLVNTSNTRKILVTLNVAGVTITRTYP